jgi:hypothetical protein
VFARILDKDKVVMCQLIFHDVLSGLSVVNLYLGWSFLDLAEDPLYYEAELSSQFKCSILCTLCTTCSCAVLVIPGLANQVI